MAARVEVTTRYAKEYMRAGKKDRGRILDEVVSVTGWSRDNARRRLSAAAKRPPGSGRQVARRPRQPRPPKFSYDARKVLQRVWATSGGQCGKYLAVSMRLQLDLLEAHGGVQEAVLHGEGAGAHELAEDVGHIHGHRVHGGVEVGEGDVQR